MDPQTEAEPTAEKKTLLSIIGPGVVTGAADDDPSGVGTYSANGAQFGYGLLWLIPISLPMMIAVQEMCGRLSSTTGNGLAAVIRDHYPKWLLYSCTGGLIVANVFNVYADLNVMAASTKMLFGMPFAWGLLIFTGVLVASQILIPYRSYAKALKWLCLSLAGYVVVAFMPKAHVDWSQVGKSLLIPHMDLKTETILGIVAFLGTTISPYLFFWQSGETVEDLINDKAATKPGARKQPVTSRELRNIRADTTVGMVVSQAVALFIIVAAAGTIHNSSNITINSAQDAARALLPLGKSAYWIFSICIIGTGLLAIPTLAGSVAYSIAETFRWRYGLYRKFKRARGFYLAIAAVVVVGGLLNTIGTISPIKALVYSAALNGIVAPPLIVVLILICNNKKIMGDRVNGPWANGFSWLAVILMGFAAVYLIYALATGKA